MCIQNKEQSDNICTLIIKFRFNFLILIARQKFMGMIFF